jgi:hypothetical protein
VNSKDLADWMTAIGTVGAVAAALFGRNIRRLWNRPRVRAIVRPNSRDHSFERIRNGHDGYDQGYFLRLWVDNQGDERAERVQVFLDLVSKAQLDGTFNPVDGFLSMNLRWAHESSGRPEAFAEVISPGIGRQCNVGGVMKSTPNEFILWTEAGPSSRSNVLPPGVYKLELKIAASNARPFPQELELRFTGAWSDDADDMYEKGVTIRKL